MKTEEEAKQETGKEFYESADKVITIKRQEEAKQRAKNSMALKGALDVKEETLDDAAEKFTENLYYKVNTVDEFNGEPLAVYNAFIEGAKWQEERMYSEEDMEKAFQNGLNRSFDSDFDRWIEQFKK